MTPQSLYDTLIKLVKEVCSEPKQKELVLFLECLQPALLVSPASSSHHDAYDGGLMGHMLNCYSTGLEVLFKKGDSNSWNISKEELLVVSILHDINKSQDAGGNLRYIPNILTKGNRSEAKPFKRNDKWMAPDYQSLNIIHPSGEKAQDIQTMTFYRMVEQFLIASSLQESYLMDGFASISLMQVYHKPLLDLLSEQEIQAIIYHDGGWNEKVGRIQGKEYPLTIFFHLVDMLASRGHVIPHESVGQVPSAR